MRPTISGEDTRRSFSGVLVALMVLTALTGLAIVAVRGSAPTATRAEQAHEIASGLRCPVCKDLSAADSPAPLARQMRLQIDEQLAAGRSAEQIRAGFVGAYGESVLMAPPHRGLGNVAYLLPLLVVGAAAGAATVVLRRWRARPASAQLPAPPLSAAARRNVEGALAQLREEDW